MLCTVFFVENVFEKVRSRTWNWANCKVLSDHILKSTENIKWTSHVPSKLNRIWNVWITIYLILPFKDQQHTQGKPNKALKILVIKRDYFFVVWLLFFVFLFRIRIQLRYWELKPWLARVFYLWEHTGNNVVIVSSIHLNWFMCFSYWFVCSSYFLCDVCIQNVCLIWFCY